MAANFIWDEGRKTTPDRGTKIGEWFLLDKEFCKTFKESSSNIDNKRTTYEFYSIEHVHDEMAYDLDYRTGSKNEGKCTKCMKKVPDSIIGILLLRDADLGS